MAIAGGGLPSVKLSIDYAGRLKILGTIVNRPADLLIADPAEAARILLSGEGPVIFDVRGGHVATVRALVEANE